MYPLFEIKKILSLAKPCGEQNVKVLHCTYSESSDRNVLALVCDNGYLVLYYAKPTQLQPVVRQFSWFSDPAKVINGLSFDPSGIWLVVVTLDASIYILPVISCLDKSDNYAPYWRSDNVTEIKLAWQRAPLTSVRWWQTQGQHIAIVGSEHGEITFVNLITKKEVGGTYITVGISALDILKDESYDTTYLLVTGTNRQQWKLLLEEKSNFYCNLNSEVEMVAYDNKGALHLENAADSDEKTNDDKPCRLSKFESGTFLTPQAGRSRNLVSAYNSASCLLQVLEGDLDQMHLFSYHIPGDCNSIILSDELIFLVQNRQVSSGKHHSILKILSRKFSEVSAEEGLRKKEHQNAEIQSFTFDEPVLAVYKRSSEYLKCINCENQPDHKCALLSNYETFLNTSSISNRQDLNRKGHSQHLESKHMEIELPKVSKLDGYYVILSNSVWECKIRLPPEVLFLSLTTVPSDLPLAEKLGIMLGLEIHQLYEVAAEIQLCHGQFAHAVHLYQLSKCPQLKRIAHFMSYGCLSELIAYIQVLFSTKSVEIVSADKCHFANIALHCFVQQVLEKVEERLSITVAFKKFIADNIYYDEAVAVKVLAEQGLHDTLHYVSEVRGQHGLAVETLLCSEGVEESIDRQSYNAIVSCGYDFILHPSDDGYVQCMTSPALLQHLAAKPSLLCQHVQHVITLLPQMTVPLLYRVASLYDLSQSIVQLALKNFMAAKDRHGFWSAGSLMSMSDNKLNLDKSNLEPVSEGDIIKFFILVLLMLCHKLNRQRFDINLLQLIVPITSSVSKHGSVRERNLASSHFLHQLSCGLTHTIFCKNGTLFAWGKAANGRLGNGNSGEEYQCPSIVTVLSRLQVKVLSVSCGALHNLALADCGVFSWGSSRYGQLGISEIQCSNRPLLIEKLLCECIISIQCGQYHSLALSENGRVFSWGWGVHGQLGHGDPEDMNVPKIIKALESKSVVALAAGQGHSVVLTTLGEIYTFGCGMFGQLGTGSSLKHSLPQLILLPEPIVIVSSGYFHTVAVSKTNRIYTWGCNPQSLRLQAQYSRRSRQNNTAQKTSHGKSSTNAAGQTNAFQQTHLRPTLMSNAPIGVLISQISCGSHHTLVVTVDGEVYTWGRNIEGQIGNGTRKEQKVPVLVARLKGHKIVYASCGADFTTVVDSNGRLWGWGKNDYCQLGQKPAEQSSKVGSLSGSSTDRVITIRTNRRMITITQPSKQSLLLPSEIILPIEDGGKNVNDSGSFDEYSISALCQPIVYNKLQDIASLSSFDKPAYGPYALHYTLKVFHEQYDVSSLLQYCHRFFNYQAAAKLCILGAHYSEALHYQLNAIKYDVAISKEEYSNLALLVIEFYTSLIKDDDVEDVTKFLCHVIEFWADSSLLIHPLEAFFEKHQDIFSYPLCNILFNCACNVEKLLVEKFLSLLSTTFCLNICTTVIKKVQMGSKRLDIMEHMNFSSETSIATQHIFMSDALTTWNDSVSIECLWKEILQNVQKGVLSDTSLQLSASDVDVLSKSLATEKLCNSQCTLSNQKENEHAQSRDMFFSCKHYYSMKAFRNLLLPEFKDSMQKVSKDLTSVLLKEFSTGKGIPFSCPRCMSSEIKNVM